LQEEEIIVYRVPADTEIILTTQSGDADIALHEAQELTEETLLCLANEPFVEDNCKAESSSGLMYASVYAVEDSTYTISASSDCSTEAINRWVYRSMNDYYLFADQVPTVDPETYSDPSDLIRDLRNNSVDPYSRVTDTQTRQAFFDEGKSFGFGAGIFSDVNDVFRIAYVYDDAPFGRAGVKRGDIVVSVGGVPFDEVIGDLTGDLYNQLVGTVDEPLTVDWTFIDGDSGVSKTITTARSEYTINTVLYSNHYSVDGFSDRIGYLVFKSFLRPSEAELDNTIAEFAEAGVTEMVLDLRYNGGGYTHIARRLAAQIGGPSLDGLRAVSYEYNDKYTDVNFNRDFAAAEPSLNLSRLVVLTSEGTASSSELLINSLRPYMEVITIGETTEGKPYISRGRDFCDKTIDAMEAQGTNSNGVSVIGGIPADCYAADDLSRNFGLQSDSIEGMLQSALNYVTDGSCSAAPVTAARSRGIEILPDNEPQFAGALDDVGTPALPIDLSKR
ncbi:MAG: hypothetical protein KTR32_04140, partial [Granulosicoccus sp.]|nr:hypothetical protein [Granulosicoccus sp.]